MQRNTHHDCDDNYFFFNEDEETSPYKIDAQANTAPTASKNSEHSRTQPNQRGKGPLITTRRSGRMPFNKHCQACKLTMIMQKPIIRYRSKDTHIVGVSHFPIIVKCRGNRNHRTLRSHNFSRSVSSFATSTRKHSCRRSLRRPFI